MHQKLLYSVRLCFLAGCCLLPFVIGCGPSSGVQRIPLKGSVTYKGEPVPAGQIRFSPDRAKGGTGPVGFANIVDGQYATRDYGKGPVIGPVNINIVGLVSAEPYAPNLFPPYNTAADLDEDTRQLDFEVPVASKRK